MVKVSEWQSEGGKERMREARCGDPSSLRFTVTSVRMRGCGESVEILLLASRDYVEGWGRIEYRVQVATDESSATDSSDPLLSMQ